MLHIPIAQFLAVPQADYISTSLFFLSSCLVLIFFCSLCLSSFTTFCLLKPKPSAATICILYYTASMSHLLSLLNSYSRERTSDYSHSFAHHFMSEVTSQPRVRSCGASNSLFVPRAIATTWALVWAVSLGMR